MDRSFPLGRRRRDTSRRAPRVAVISALTLAFASGLVGSAVDTAAADRERELDRHKSSITRGIDRQQTDLRRATRRVDSASGALESSRVQLGEARRGLTSTLGQLAAARQVDVEARSRLAAVDQRLDIAEGDLAQARSLVSDTQEGLERFVVESMSSSNPSLISVDALAAGDDGLGFPEVLSFAESVASAQTSSIDDLEAAQVMMRLREERVEQLRRLAARERARAAEHLTRTTGLVAEARDRRQQVQALVLERRDSRRNAASARQRDRRALKSMRAERERVSALLSKVRMRQALQPPTTSSSGSAGSSRSTSSSGSTGNGVLSSPVPGAYVSSPFGMRLHPIFKVMKLHDGTDFGAGCGTPVRAAASGRVVSQSYNTGFGNQVVIAHGTVNGTSVATSYNHLSSFSTSWGQQVARGDIIGSVGNTGFSTGCHLHFMVYANGSPVDPAGWL